MMVNAEILFVQKVAQKLPKKTFVVRTVKHTEASAFFNKNLVNPEVLSNSIIMENALNAVKYATGCMTHTAEQTIRHTQMSV